MLTCGWGRNLDFRRGALCAVRSPGGLTPGVICTLTSPRSLLFYFPSAQAKFSLGWTHSQTEFPALH